LRAYTSFAGKPFKWKQLTGTYQNGEDLLLNKIYIASCIWNSGRSRDADDSTRYVSNITLPSLSDKVKRMYASSLEELKPKVEKVITHWFDEALKQS
jgi:hypothetical protein